MDILYVILTALLVVAAVTMILKKVDTRLTFLFLGVIGLAAATIIPANLCWVTPPPAMYGWTFLM